MVTKKSRGKKFSKKAAMKGDPLLNLAVLPTYLEKLSKLSKGKLSAMLANLKLITNLSHDQELKQAKITGQDSLLDIINYKNFKVY